MKRPNNLTISLPQQRLEQLEKFSQEGETIGQTAKRLLLGILDADIASQHSISEDQLEGINLRVTNLDEDLQALKNSIDSRFEQFTLGIAAVNEQIQKLLEKETAVNDSVQNHSQPIGLTNPQLAERLNLNRSSVSRWTKKGSDPSGEWIWRDGLWFQK